MKTLLRRSAVVLMAFAMTMSMMPLLGAVTGGAAGTQTAYAETYENFQPEPPDGFKYTIYDDGGAGSIWVTGYVGTDTQVILPSSVTCNGVTFRAWDSNNNSQGNGAFIIDSAVFAGNTSITKVAVPYGYEALMAGAFKGCTGLTEIAIADTVEFIQEDVFDDCSSLTTYYYSGEALLAAGSEDAAIKMIIDSGMAQGADGKPIGGVTVYAKPGSPVEKAVEEINKKADDPADPAATIKVVPVTEADPYEQNTVTPESSQSGGAAKEESGGSGGQTAPVSKKGKDGTAYGKGATEDVVQKAVTKYAAEKDPKGTTFRLLRARLYSAKKDSVTLTWTKVKGAKKYVVYGNACGKKNKMVKLLSTGKVKAVFKKVNKKKVKKGTYYKFMVVALDKKGQVLSSSKMVHAATSGGKVGNDKAVTTKAKKNKVSVRKGKTFKLGAKPVAQNKKLAVKRHRGLAYESSNPKVATVSAKGVIKGKKKGSCTVYVYAQNGVFKAIKVTVK